ncbi:MAG: hypothetical protein J3R72DRAFT_441029 [Linnemannia gamsii]|nr:MAG: hypothetical protein J3R72DRAFT_441029 [Linnemannia gamsii]
MVCLFLIHFAAHFQNHSLLFATVFVSFFLRLLFSQKSSLTLQHLFVTPQVIKRVGSPSAGRAFSRSEVRQGINSLALKGHLSSPSVDCSQASSFTVWCTLLLLLLFSFPSVLCRLGLWTLDPHAERPIAFVPKPSKLNKRIQEREKERTGNV